MTDESTSSPIEASQTPQAKPSSSKKRKTRAKKVTQTHRKAKAPVGRAFSVPYPPVPISDVLPLANAIQQYGAGHKIRHLTLFEKMQRSPDSGPSKMLIINSARYGLTKGSYSAEFLELTELGAKATNPETSEADKLDALFQLAIEHIPAFKHLYDMYKNNRLPPLEVMRDALGDANVPEENRKECAELFLENVKSLGLLRTIAGAERLLPVEQVIEEKGGPGPTAIAQKPEATKVFPAPTAISKKEWDKICFVISPIGSEGSEDRKHADMVLEALVVRALEGEGYQVVRADKITDPGMISSQVIEYILNSGLVIADLSFHNPNVFYELAIRHFVGKPTVHIIRKSDHIPFDVKDFRTIVIDTEDKYQLIASLETYRAEIANYARVAVAGGSENVNPIRAFVPNLVVSHGPKK